MRVLMTGGAGFLGRAVARSLDRRDLWADIGRDPPELLTVYSRDEAKQYEMRQRYPELDGRVRYVLGDINDRERLAAVMVGHDAVIHAAAIKFIPEAEHNVRETIRVNVEGSLAVYEAATQARVAHLLGISTDKACAPLNTYGMTKALMERQFQVGRPEGRTVVVRYGNVIGSTGSVVPVFLRQLHDEGRLRLTNPAMTRFWMRADDAVRAILHALGDTRDRVIYVPEMRSLSLEAVAAAVQRYAGAAADYELMPVRPGEKLDEELVTEAESFRTHRPLAATGRPRYMMVEPASQTAPYAEGWAYSSRTAERLDAADFAYELRVLRELGELPTA